MDKKYITKMDVNYKKIFNISNVAITLFTIGTLVSGIIAYKNSKPKQIDLSSPIRGCDISEYQRYTNWDELSKNFDFIIIRASEGKQEDSKFEENYKNATKHHMDIGIYTVNAMSALNTNSLEEFKKATENRIDRLIEILKNKKVKYPVYLDIEFLKNPVEKALPKEYANSLIDIFYNKMKNNGYIPGVYSNKHTYDYLKNNVKNFDKLEVWVAGGDDYDKITSLENTTSANKNYSDSIRMVQSYRYVTNAGAENSSGHLDVDYTYRDYYSKKVDYKNYGLSALCLSMAGYTLYGKKNKIKRKVEKR